MKIMENNILGRMNIFFIALSMDPEGCSDYTKKIKVTKKYGIVSSYFCGKKIEESLFRWVCMCSV